ncbi:MAG TPA: helix-turn-helix domain-containing protein [Thermoanaerobaculia bacterium]|jgi:transcriptional regulator with XRE-family HTH domain
MSFSTLEIAALYTFGSPRVLSPEAAAYAQGRLLDGRIFRHARSGDVVAAVPRRLLPLPGGGEREIYAHVGEVVWIDEAGEVRFGRAAWESARPGLDRIRDGLGKDPDLAAAIERHRLAPYQTAAYEQFYRDPEPRPGGWSPAVALACARAVRILYEGAEEAMFAMLGFQRARVVEVRGTVQALAAVPVTAPERAFAVVAFRGDDLTSLPEGQDWQRTLCDWMTGLEVDLEAWHPGTPGRTHGRWLREVKRLERPIEREGAKVCGSLPIVATGHGKGAGLATLWALRRAQESQARRAEARKELAEDVLAARPRPAAGAGPGRWPWAEKPGGGLKALTSGEVGARIRHLRETWGLTQADLAAVAGYEQSNISRLETGEYRVHIDTLWTILAQLDVSLAEFFELPREEDFSPGTIRMLEQYYELDEEDRAAARNLLQFKLEQSREEVLFGSQRRRRRRQPT